MSRIFFDTNLFIYLLEDRGERGARVNGIVERISERRDELLTSTLTLAEVLVKPLSVGDNDWADRYEKLLNTPGVVMLTFDRPAARIYALLRRDRTLAPPDAIQLACAASARCDLFITNDERLSRRTVPGIQFITSLERAPV
ncbi:MAG: type II toxin-antitoxin system VapC family toxin [Bryobacteraceae bacterium]|nr:type II toxin-antitoxin system VapC family toxin [Bryobacteraceae bacterium]